VEEPDALTFKGVSKKLGRTQALDNLSFRIPVGSVSAFVGNNGAGKTTTFSIVARYLRLSRGSVHVFGMPLARYYRQGGIVGVLPQDAEFFDDVRVWKQIVYFCRLAGFGGKSAKDEAERVLNLCSLSDKAQAYPGDLSRGMRVRLGVAQALIASPKLLLLDEPTAGLDPGMVLQFRELVDDIKREATVVISSHDVSELEQMCDYVCYIDKGSLVREEPIGVLKKEISRVVYTVENEVPEFASFATAFADCNFTRREKNQLVVDFDPARFPLGDLNKRILSWFFESDSAVLEVRPESSIERLFRR
jgi:ABC-type multidrug transport system ATPase subunit